MKDFFKYVMATVVGVIIVGIIGFVLLSLTVMGMLASDDSKVKAKDNSVFVLKMNGTVSERTEGGSPIDQIIGMANGEAMGLDDILKAIRLARDEKNIKGIYIEGGTTIFDAPATAQQVRDALLDFKKSGKMGLCLCRPDDAGQLLRPVCCRLALPQQDWNDRLQRTGRQARIPRRPSTRSSASSIRWLA